MAVRTLICSFVLAASAALPSAAAQRNVLLVVADDLGVDRVGCYGESPDELHTPVIDGLAAQGVLFRNAWSTPVCSPSRATLLTGRYGFRTGLGTIIQYDSDTEELPLEECTLAELLQHNYETVAIGKWHLSVSKDEGPFHPLLDGFRHHRGSMQALPLGATSYFMWDKAVDGVISQCRTYATTDTVNDAVATLSTLSEPWFLYLAFNAPHSPYHKPPPELHTYTLPPLVQGNLPIHMKAMTEALDTELGRLLATMDPRVLANTVIIFIGDNGTDPQAITAPFPKNHGKGTVFEGGINVPLIVSGAGVAHGECAALVNSTDVYATVADIAGLASKAEDSVSLTPYLLDPCQPSQRDWAYSETFSPNGFGDKPTWLRAVREQRFKLIAKYHGESSTPLWELLFDLQADPFEQRNLLESLPLTAEAAAARTYLRGVLDTQKLSTWTDVHHGKAGSKGVPVLTGTGSLLAGEPVSLTLGNAAPGLPTALFIGFKYAVIPCKGGICVPSDDIVVTGLVTDEEGGFTLASSWPPGLPADMSVYYQAWSLESGLPVTAIASNGLLSITP